MTKISSKKNAESSLNELSFITSELILKVSFFVNRLLNYRSVDPISSRYIGIFELYLPGNVDFI